MTRLTHIAVLQAAKMIAAIFGWIYNQLAGWLGGFEVRLETR